MAIFIQNNFFGRRPPMPINGHCVQNYTPMPMDTPMFNYGGCMHSHSHHHCDGGNFDDGLGKAVLWGGAVGLGAGLIYNFRKPIGSFLGMCGKGIGQGATWLWNNALKPVGQAIGKAAKWVWNGITGLFKKKDKDNSAEGVRTQDSAAAQVTTPDPQALTMADINKNNIFDLDHGLDQSFIS